MGDAVVLFVLAVVILGVFIQLAVLSALFEKVEVLQARMDMQEGYIIAIKAAVDDSSDGEQWKREGR